MLLRAPRTLLATIGAFALPLFLAACGSGGSRFCTGTCPIQPPAEFLVATTNGGQVASLPIDLQTGTLGTATTVAGPQMSLGLATSSFQFVYVSDFSNAAIYGYSINATTGVLTALSGSPFSTGPLSVPAGLAAPASGSFLYAADALQIDGYSIGSGGVPTALGGAPFSSPDGSEHAFFSTAGFLYAANDDPPGGLLAFKFDGTGTLTPVPGSPFAFSGQTGSDSRPFGIATDFFGKFVYAALTQSGQVAGFSVDATTGILTPLPGSPWTVGTLPTFLSSGGNGDLYVMNSGDATISAFQIDTTSGVLTPVAGSPFAANATAGMIADPGAARLYAASPGAGIVGFSMATDGSLTPIPGSPFPLVGPVLLTIVQMPGQGG